MQLNFSELVLLTWYGRWRMLYTDFGRLVNRFRFNIQFFFSEKFEYMSLIHYTWYIFVRRIDTKISNYLPFDVNQFYGQLFFIKSYNLHESKHLYFTGHSSETQNTMKSQCYCLFTSSNVVCKQTFELIFLANKNREKLQNELFFSSVC